MDSAALMLHWSSKRQPLLSIPACRPLNSSLHSLKATHCLLGPRFRVLQEQLAAATAEASKAQATADGERQARAAAEEGALAKEQALSAELVALQDDLACAKEEVRSGEEAAQKESQKLQAVEAALLNAQVGLCGRGASKKAWSSCGFKYIELCGCGCSAAFS